MPLCQLLFLYQFKKTRMIDFRLNRKKAVARRISMALYGENSLSNFFVRSSNEAENPLIMNDYPKYGRPVKGRTEEIINKASDFLLTDRRIKFFVITIIEVGISETNVFKILHED